MNLGLEGSDGHWSLTGSSAQAIPQGSRAEWEDLADCLDRRVETSHKRLALERFAGRWWVTNPDMASKARDWVPVDDPVGFSQMIRRAFRA